MLFQSQIVIEVGLAMGIGRKVVKICKIEGVVPQLKHHFIMCMTLAHVEKEWGLSQDAALLILRFLNFPEDTLQVLGKIQQDKYIY